MQIQIVLTTLDSRKMNELPVYMGAASCRGRLSKSMGQGCIYDPPGYPTYFLQSIYNRSGDVDNDMPSGVIVWNGEKRIVGKSANDCGTNWNEECCII